jgi:hypothetical protein
MPTDTASPAAKAIASFRAKVDTIGGNAGLGGRRPAPNFYALNAMFIGQLTAQDNADQAPTEATFAAHASACHDLSTAATAWTALNTKELATLNAALGAGGIQPVAAATGPAATPLFSGSPRASSRPMTPRRENTSRTPAA